MEAQYCPFAATGEDAHPDAAHLKAQKEKHGHVVRRMTRSNISHEHKGVLTVTLVGASGLTVCICPFALSGTPWRWCCPVTGAWELLPMGVPRTSHGQGSAKRAAHARTHQPAECLRPRARLSGVISCEVSMLDSVSSFRLLYPILHAASWYLPSPGLTFVAPARFCPVPPPSLLCALFRPRRPSQRASTAAGCHCSLPYRPPRRRAMWTPSWS